MKSTSKERYDMPQVTVMQIGGDNCILNGSGYVVVGPGDIFPD